MSSKSTTGRWLWIAGVAALTAAQAGCVATSEAMKDRLKHSLVGNYVYDQPIEVIWPEVQRLLKDAGYAAKETPDAFVLITDWQVADGSMVSGHSSRYLVQGKRIDVGRCIVRFMRHESIADSMPEHVTAGAAAFSTRAAAGLGEMRRASGGMQASRDLAMEWKLLERVRPEAAAAIDLEAGRRLGVGNGDHP
jgi:hypothetical protein